MQLTNEYFEALLGGEAPDPADVAQWSQRVLPLLDEMVDEFEGVGEDMRGFMTEDQQVVLDGQLAAFRVATSYMTQRAGCLE